MNSSQSIWFVVPLPIKKQCYDSSRALKVSNYENKERMSSKELLHLGVNSLGLKIFYSDCIGIWNMEWAQPGSF